MTKLHDKSEKDLTQERVVGLLKTLIPGDSFLFENNGREYFHILEVRGNSVIGDYVSSDNDREERMFSFEEIAKMDPLPRVAHYQKIYHNNF